MCILYTHSCACGEVSRKNWEICPLNLSMSCSQYTEKHVPVENKHCRQCSAPLNEPGEIKGHDFPALQRAARLTNDKKSQTSDTGDGNVEKALARGVSIPITWDSAPQRGPRGTRRPRGQRNARGLGESTQTRGQARRGAPAARAGARTSSAPSNPGPLPSERSNHQPSRGTEGPKRSSVFIDPDFPPPDPSFPQSFAGRGWPRPNRARNEPDPNAPELSIPQPSKRRGGQKRQCGSRGRGRPRASGAPGRQGRAKPEVNSNISPEVSEDHGLVHGIESVPFTFRMRSRLDPEAEEFSPAMDEKSQLNPTTSVFAPAPSNLPQIHPTPEQYYPAFNNRFQFDHAPEQFYPDSNMIPQIDAWTGTNYPSWDYQPQVYAKTGEYYPSQAFYHNQECDSNQGFYPNQDCYPTPNLATQATSWSNAFYSSYSEVPQFDLTPATFYPPQSMVSQVAYWSDADYPVFSPLSRTYPPLYEPYGDTAAIWYGPQWN